MQSANDTSALSADEQKELIDAAETMGEQLAAMITLLPMTETQQENLMEEVQNASPERQALLHATLEALLAKPEIDEANKEIEIMITNFASETEKEVVVMEKDTNQRLQDILKKYSSTSA